MGDIWTVQLGFMWLNEPQCSCHHFHRHHHHQQKQQQHQHHRHHITSLINFIISANQPEQHFKRYFATRSRTLGSLGMRRPSPPPEWEGDLDEEEEEGEGEEEMDFRQQQEEVRFCLI